MIVLERRETANRRAPSLWEVRTPELGSRKQVNAAIQGRTLAGPVDSRMINSGSTEI
jgi:hypothetical protein